jgi:hypothetical protein
MLRKELLQSKWDCWKIVLQPSKQFRRLHANEFSEHETNYMYRKRREMKE